MTLVGWYAHHLGAGHVVRALTVAPLMRSTVVLLSSASRPPEWPAECWIALPRDDAPGGDDHAAGGVLHWAPLGHQGYTDRMTRIAGWVRDARPSALVVDVSAEVTLLARALGVPVATVVMAGDRSDRTHQMTYDAATALVACWPAGFQPVRGWRERWNPKTTWTGAFSRFDGREPAPPPGSLRAMWLWGRGGDRLISQQVALAREVTPAWAWNTSQDLAAADVWKAMQGSDLVVTHGGQNALAEVAAARRRAVVLPQPRPHDEQVHLTRALATAGLARPHERWPEPDEWPQLLDRAAPQDPADWSRWSDGRGASRMADALDAFARRQAA